MCQIHSVLKIRLLKANTRLNNSSINIPYNSLTSRNTHNTTKLLRKAKITTKMMTPLQMTMLGKMTINNNRLTTRQMKVTAAWVTTSQMSLTKMHLWGTDSRWSISIWLPTDNSTHSQWSKLTQRIRNPKLSRATVTGASTSAKPIMQWRSLYML